MVTNPKRMKCVFNNNEDIDISSEEDSLDEYDVDICSSGVLSDETEQCPKFEFQRHQTTQNPRGSGRKPKCFSKNALMARENRLKKKLYVMKLEKEASSLKVENKNIKSVVQRQSQLLIDLKKEVKYLRSVIANSKDIGNLMRSINRSTGMSVSSSLDESISTLKDVCVSKCDQKKTADWWDEEKDCPVLESSPLLSSDVFLNEAVDMDCFNDLDMDCFNDLDSPLIVQECSQICDNEQTSNLKELDALEEHNYTATNHSVGPEVLSLDNDVGVCLHVSKHRVSLEFCSTCSEKAINSWLD